MNRSSNFTRISNVSHVLNNFRKQLDNGSWTSGTAVSGEGGGEAGEAEEDAGEQQARQRQDGRGRSQVHLHGLQVQHARPQDLQAAL